MTDEREREGEAEEEEEENCLYRNYWRINIRTLKSTMLKECNDIIHDDDDDDNGERWSVHSPSLMRDFD